MGRNTCACFRLLSNARRQAIIAALDPDAPPMALADLAGEVAAAEANDVLDGDVDFSGTQQVYLSLYHAHVPMLADAGVVAFDADRRTVTDGPHFDVIRSCMGGHCGARL